MIYAYALTMFASLLGVVSALLAGLSGSLPIHTALLATLVAALTGLFCACGIDRLER